MFFLHLALEKIIKAVYISKLDDSPPYIHNLKLLITTSKIEVSGEELKQLDEISEFNVSARYDDYKYKIYKRATEDYTKNGLRLVKNYMKNIKKIANKYIAEVIKSGIPVSSAYLFGSYAKGNSNKYSDIDICIISPKFGKDYFEESLKLRFITSVVDLRIEAVPLNPKDLDDKYSTLASEIKKYGILVS